MAPEDRLEDVVDSLADGEPLLALVQRGFAVEIWDVEQREMVADHPLSHVLSALSPDGRLFAGVQGGDRVGIRDGRTGRLVREIQPEVRFIRALAFSPDGTVLAVADGEGRAALWDVVSGSPMAAALEVGAGWAMLDFSPDGRRLLATTDQGTASVSDLDPQPWADRACVVANRTLTESEWAEYLPGRPYQPACAQ